MSKKFSEFSEKEQEIIGEALSIYEGMRRNQFEQKENNHEYLKQEAEIAAKLSSELRKFRLELLESRE